MHSATEAGGGSHARHQAVWRPVGVRSATRSASHPWRGPSAAQNICACRDHAHAVIMRMRGAVTQRALMCRSSFGLRGGGEALVGP